LAYCASSSSAPAGAPLIMTPIISIQYANAVPALLSEPQPYSVAYKSHIH
jgi:hypothetical protein